jgi:hypothetical protein
MKGEAEELYDRGVAGICAEPMDPVELLPARRYTICCSAWY